MRRRLGIKSRTTQKATFLIRDLTELVAVGLFVSGLACFALGASDTIRAHRADASADQAIALAATEAGR